MTDVVIQMDSPLAAESAGPDPLFLFACRLSWLREQDEEALEVLRAAAQSGDPRASAIGQGLLQDMNPPVQPTD